MASKAKQPPAVNSAEHKAWYDCKRNGTVDGSYEQFIKAVGPKPSPLHHISTSPKPHWVGPKKVTLQQLVTYIVTALFSGTAVGLRWMPEYRPFYSARARCLDSKNNRYKSYGAAGVKFLFPDFLSFYWTVGPRPSRKHSLGRKLDSGNYEAGNCWWQTPDEQAEQRRLKRQLEKERAA